MVECGSSGRNTENLTANHSGATCWEKCHVPRTLKNPSLVFSRIRVHGFSAPPQETKLPDPTHLSLFQVAIKICRLHYPCVPSHFHFIIILCSFYHPLHDHRLNITEYCCPGVKHQQSLNQSINQSINQSMWFFLNKKSKSTGCSHMNHLLPNYLKDHS